jgi:hypothetical protein
MIEAGVVVGRNGEPIYWHLPNARTSVYLPDSSELWSVLWNAHTAGILEGFAHTHPGSGVPGPSGTDLTTFAAIESGLGKRLKWWILSSDHVVRLDYSSDLGYESTNVLEPSWAERLRQLSI